MKSYFRLIQYEFTVWLKAILFICLGVIVVPLFLLNMAVKDYGEYSVHERFEDIYASSGSILVFLLALAAICAYFLKTVYAGYWGSKSVYTYLTLPVKREFVYFSKLAVFVICLLMLLGAQLISITLGYEIVAAKVASYGDGRYVMANGLFLAFIRSDFFRLIMPLSFSRLLSTLCMISIIVTSFYYGAICERSKRYWGFLFIGIAFLIAFRTLNYRMGESQLYLANTHLYPSSLLLLLCSGFFIWHSIKLINKGAIA